MDFTKVRHTLFITLLVLVSLAFIFMMKPFFYPIFWAAVIAGLFYPFYEWLNDKLKIPNLSTTITLSLIVIVILLPLLTAGYFLVKESADLYGSINTNRDQINRSLHDFATWIKYNPFSAQLNFDEKLWSQKFTEASTLVVNFIFNNVTGLTQNSLAFVFMIVIMFYTLFFFIRDGEKMLRLVMRICPLGDKYEKMLYAKFTLTAKAALKGTIIVGGIQGVIGALLFWFVGIKGILIWGLLMTALSIVPPFSAALVWLPASIILMLTGKFWAGMIVLAVGVLIISTIDNVLRPIIVGRDAELHPLLVLFSTLGGLMIFGVSGFVIGPVLAALFVTFWQMYEHYYKNELRNN